MMHSSVLQPARLIATVIGVFATLFQGNVYEVRKKVDSRVFIALLKQ